MILKLKIGALAGGELGFAYFKFVGCASGVCPVTSHPVIIGTIVANCFR